MRTILRLGTGIVITVLVASAAASCALPAYVSSGGSSSGGGGAASGSGGAGATSSSSGARDGGKDGDVGASSGSTSSSSGMNVSDGGDGGLDCKWGHCPLGTKAGDGCTCPLQACYIGMCDPVMGTGTVSELVCSPGPTSVWKALPVMAPGPRCCPGLQQPCESGDLCVVTSIPGKSDMPACVVPPQACTGPNADMPCKDPTCMSKLCSNVKAPQCGMTGMGPGYITCTP